MADIFVEKVRESERAALECQKKAQADAKELIDTAKRNGERLLALAERDGAKLCSASAQEDAALAEQLLKEADEKAKNDAAVLRETASSRMDQAVALIFQRVGGVWQ